VVGLFPHWLQGCVPHRLRGELEIYPAWSVSAPISGVMTADPVTPARAGGGGADSRLSTPDAGAPWEECSVPVLIIRSAIRRAEPLGAPAGCIFPDAPARTPTPVNGVQAVGAIVDADFLGPARRILIPCLYRRNRQSTSSRVGHASAPQRGAPGGRQPGQWRCPAAQLRQLSC
jgi:hypothetical protein